MMVNMFGKIKDGLKMGKEKAVNTISNILKSRENRAIAGIILGSLSAGLILSAYVKLPQ